MSKEFKLKVTPIGTLSDEEVNDILYTFVEKVLNQAIEEDAMRKELDQTSRGDSLGK